MSGKGSRVRHFHMHTPDPPTGARSVSPALPWGQIKAALVGVWPAGAQRLQSRAERVDWPPHPRNAHGPVRFRALFGGDGRALSAPGIVAHRRPLSSWPCIVSAVHCVAQRRPLFSWPRVGAPLKRTGASALTRTGDRSGKSDTPFNASRSPVGPLGRVERGGVPGTDTTSACGGG